MYDAWWVFYFLVVVKIIGSSIILPIILQFSFKYPIIQTIDLRENLMLVG